ncbi:Protein of unknown function [Pyronema omphalodes CBS 100304]|uniref:Uncharacterized protein n=1 Tax=Pyronema omphalodes (strain CBS 100304) TaxID=1076935 RepID=U4KZ14_PYROM|nr:Protein of unknown function [Pyronema omphalodes CBS 100304]
MFPTFSSTLQTYNHYHHHHHAFLQTVRSVPYQRSSEHDLAPYRLLVRVARGVRFSIPSQSGYDNVPQQCQFYGSRCPCSAIFLTPRCFLR